MLHTVRSFYMLQLVRHYSWRLGPPRYISDLVLHSVVAFFFLLFFSIQQLSILILLVLSLKQMISSVLTVMVLYNTAVVRLCCVMPPLRVTIKTEQQRKIFWEIYSPGGDGLSTAPKARALSGQLYQRCSAGGEEWEQPGGEDSLWEQS